MISSFRITATICLLIGADVALLAQSNTRAQTAPTPGTVTFLYDSLGRIEAEQYPDGAGGHGYDDAGNRAEEWVAGP